jgi:hypothetical protein
MGEIPAGIPVQVPGPRGGILNRGGTFRGAGRKPSKIRDALRLSFEKRYRVWESIADDEKSQPGDRMRAVELLAKYGIGLAQGIPREEVVEKLKASLDLLKAQLPDPEATLIIARMRKIWA